jgi:ubiquinone/menaquinone biosynthesis C-methylase UbiE
VPSREDAGERAQRDYYTSQARRYDASHVDSAPEHQLALSFMVGALPFLDVGSVLDVGAGTGRVLLYLSAHAAAVARAGIEPVPALRQVAYEKGVDPSELQDGDATRLAYPDGAFDLVCEFGMLHHVRDHARVVREMLRVARKAVFLSDSNNFGQGSSSLRAVKQALRAVGLWRVADLVKTRGRGYTVTEGDGVSYSYSVFDDYSLVRASCRSVHLLNTRDAGVNPYRSASHVALLGIK